MALSDKLLQNPGALCNMVRRIALEAGEITLDYFEPDIAFETKADNSPVTQADREAEAFIHKALGDLLPGVPVIAEEAVSAGNIPALGGADYFWLVDPLDGTRQFVAGNEDYTVNIALVHKDTPMLGVVYAPAKGLLYAGHGEGTAVRWSADNENEKPIAIRRQPAAGITVIAGLHREDEGRMQKFLDQFKVEKLLRRGSSLKLCLVAEGKADLYPRFGLTSEWDTAAGDAVLRAAGGSVRAFDGSALRYGGAERKFENPEFVAAAFDWHMPA